MRFFTTIVAIIFTLHLTAQEQSNSAPRDINKNEFSLNPLSIIAFGALDIGYERVLTDNTTLGFDFFYRFSDEIDQDDDIIDRDGIYDKEIALTVNYKYFFGSRIARGFYIEGFGMLSNGEHEEYVQFTDPSGDFIRGSYVDMEFTDFAIGFGVGGKFVTKKGFFLDIGIGIGRNLFNNNSPDIIVRPDLYLGYRF
ncbi:hypothetical protein D1815_04385 [Aquimarina sp. AD1]|uniref:hypothetical protein n=1 Tax=Aquimarina sp. (strain AD1) TaxID=1714848 RepID=UPI000E4A3E4A|nr:hypothetical protein [Aquimarina sp. AD1]AXT55029.1 hypothetical protein D1815_04385 [Aquimarina sp. AD1]RKN01135.1 hypothetical protein D7035_23340 [Aquimarina sp. AD1]